MLRHHPLYLSILDQLELIRVLRYSPGGNVLLAGSDQGLRVLNPKNQILMNTYNRNVGQSIETIAFSPDGSTMAYGNDGGGLVVTPNVFDSGRP